MKLAANNPTDRFATSVRSVSGRAATDQLGEVPRLLEEREAGDALAMKGSNLCGDPLEHLLRRPLRPVPILAIRNS